MSNANDSELCLAWGESKVGWLPREKDDRPEFSSGGISFVGVRFRVLLCVGDRSRGRNRGVVGRWIAKRLEA
jgi:hypothetical protein